MTSLEDNGIVWVPDNEKSVRDWFAAHALAGLLAGQYSDTAKYNLSEVPTEAFKIADAMMIERSA